MCCLVPQNVGPAHRGQKDPNRYMQLSIIVRVLCLDFELGLP